MSVEVVTRDDGTRYLIVGTPDAGYDIHRVDTEPVVTFDHKYVARRAILDGQIQEPPANPFVVFPALTARLKQWLADHEASTT